MKHKSSFVLAVLCSAILSLSCRAQTSTIQPGDRTSGQSESTLTLAQNGQALQQIVIAADASEKIKETANYLAEKLGKMSGAAFEVQTGDGSRGIVLGTIAQFPVAALQKPLELRPAPVGLRNGVEAYGIRVEKDRVLLLGGGEPGASHAASRFLELLGYRRFYPAPEWEIAPQQSTLKFNRNETDRPEILARHMWYAFGVPMDPITMDVPADQRRIRSSTDLPAWYRQNRLGESFHVFAAHNYATIALALKDQFEAHPEYRILLNGQRSPRGICTSQPAVRAMGAKLALEYFEKNPDADMYSMERGDGTVTCECELCQAKGNESNRVFDFADYVAREVKQKYPGKMIGVLAYNTHDVPPDFALEPNVHVQVARLFIQSGKTFRQLVEEWSQKTKNLGVYDYFSTFQWGQDRLRPRANAGPTADLSLLKSDIPFLAEHGVLSLWSETSVAWGAHGRGNLVATRLMWNPQTDVDAVLQDFYDKAFGPAASAMKKYFERVDGQNDLFSNTLLGNAFRDVDEAAKLAKDRRDVQARIDHIKQFLIYNYINTRFSDATDNDEKKKWFGELLAHEFRTRYAYLTHWQARTNYLADYAKRYNEPSWLLPDWKVVAALKKEGKPIPTPSWQKAPYTHEETEARFQVGLQYFKPQAILPRVTFSGDLVPVQWPVAPPAPAHSVVQLGDASTYLYSIAGEPLEISLKTGKTGDPVGYTLRDKDGNAISEGQLPQDEATHDLKLNVPRAGLYIFGSERSMNHTVPTGRADTISLAENQGTRYTLAGFGGRNFFYVPKGTKQLQYFWNGGDHVLYDPDGKPIKIAGVTDYVTVDVPAGMDGKMWSFNGRLDTRVFVNAPNYVAPAPDALMVPRELAEKDGLVVRN